MVKKNTTWWNKEVKATMKIKKECYLALQKCKKEENLSK